MDLRKAKQLLEKYYNGETSVQDEKKLQDFLLVYCGTDEDLQMAKYLFESLASESQEKVALDFETIIQQKPVIKFAKPVYNVWLAVAAVLLVAFVIGVLVKTTQRPIVYAYVNGTPITDQQVAMQQSQKALYNISSQLNKGTKGLILLNNLNKPAALLTAKK